MIISKISARLNKLKFYFTGKVCPNGHVTQRYVSTGQCLSCEKDRRKRYKYPRDSKVCRESSRQYRARNGDKVRARMAAWRAKNRIEINQYQRAWRKKHKISLAKKSLARRNAKPEYYREIAKKARAKQRLKNPEREREKQRRYENARRAKKRGTGGSYSLGDIELIMALQNKKCAYCRSNLKNKYNIDHILPISLGGSNQANNLQILCIDCNGHKHNKHPIDYARQIGLLL